MSGRNAIDGGPAFPLGEVTKYAGAPAETTEFYEGMSLRDYFAAKSLGYFSAFTRIALGPDGLINDEDTATVAVNCYAIADAMLKAREG